MIRRNKRGGQKSANHLPSATVDIGLFASSSTYLWCCSQLHIYHVLCGKIFHHLARYSADDVMAGGGLMDDVKDEKTLGKGAVYEEEDGRACAGLDVCGMDFSFNNAGGGQPDSMQADGAVAETLFVLRQCITSCKCL